MEGLSLFIFPIHIGHIMLFPCVLIGAIEDHGDLILKLFCDKDG